MVIGYLWWTMEPWVDGWTLIFRVVFAVCYVGIFVLDFGNDMRMF